MKPEIITRTRDLSPNPGTKRGENKKHQEKVLHIKRRRKNRKNKHEIHRKETNTHRIRDEIDKFDYQMMRNPRKVKDPVKREQLYAAFLLFFRETQLMDLL